MRRNFRPSSWQWTAPAKSYPLGRSHETEDRPLQVFLELKNSQVFQYAPFDLFQVKVIFIEDLRSFPNIQSILSGNIPGQIEEPIQVVPGNRIFPLPQVKCVRVARFPFPRQPEPPEAFEFDRVYPGVPGSRDSFPRLPPALSYDLKLLTQKYSRWRLSMPALTFSCIF
jgi:hypothetical protein